MNTTKEATRSDVKFTRETADGVSTWEITVRGEDVETWIEADVSFRKSGSSRAEVATVDGYTVHLPEGEHYFNAKGFGTRRALMEAKYFATASALEEVNVPVRRPDPEADNLYAVIKAVFGVTGFGDVRLPNGWSTHVSETSKDRSWADETGTPVDAVQWERMALRALLVRTPRPKGLTAAFAHSQHHDHGMAVDAAARMLHEGRWSSLPYRGMAPNGNPVWETEFSA
jgi:hypothetical protein